MNFIQKFSKKAVFLYVILAFLFSVSVKKAEATPASDCIAKAMRVECNELCENHNSSWFYNTLNS